jgi:hypothetical protein
MKAVVPGLEGREMGGDLTGGPSPITLRHREAVARMCGMGSP